MVHRVAMVCLGALVLAPPGASAQQTFPPKSFVNLQVLPKDSSAATVVGTMKSFANNLGVRCQFCHVGEEGLPLEQFDFAADVKPAKRTARVMMRLTRDINAQLDAALAIAGNGAPRVSCITCHRGKSTPTNVREP
jgi:hypothetical protein